MTVLAPPGSPAGRRFLLRDDAIMSTSDDVLFLDANQYLDLYRLIPREGLLDSLQNLKAYIFIPMQIVDEVLRNKLGVAERYFKEQYREVDEIKKTQVPEHLFGIDARRTAELREKLSQARNARNELEELANDALRKISRSQDDVSLRLSELFNNPIAPTVEELERARARKERGNPPGKPNDPLGDQLIWEQLLTHCKKHKRRLWMIAKDSDYGPTVAKHEFVLNSLLYRDLIDTGDRRLEVFCFTNMQAGIEDFVSKTGVNLPKLATGEEAKEVKKALDALPPIGWLDGMMMSMNPPIFRRARPDLYGTQVFQAVPPSMQE